MTNLTYKERITVQLMRNKKAGLKPANQADIAKKFGLSPMYVSIVVNEVQFGKNQMNGVENLLNTQVWKFRGGENNERINQSY